MPMSANWLITRPLSSRCRGIEVRAKSGRPSHNRSDISGMVFGRLTVISPEERCEKPGILKWLCMCECGTSSRVLASKLKSGLTQSCGCLKRERMSARTVKHGLFLGDKRPKLWSTYSGMLSRCSNPDNQDYAGYGGRGIKVCDRWLNGDGVSHGYFLFVKDMGPRPSSAHSLDRRDNDLGYSPENCRWASAKQQARNRRSNRKIVVNGEAMALSEYCDRYHLNFVLMNQRMCRGWSLDRAVAQPARRSRSIA